MARTLSPRRAVGPVGEAPPSASLLRNHRRYVLAFHRGLEAASLGPSPGLQQVESTVPYTGEASIDDAKLVDHSDDDEKKLDLSSEANLVNHSVDDGAKLVNHSVDDEAKLVLSSEAKLVNHSDVDVAKLVNHSEDDEASPPCLSDVASVCPLACTSHALNEAPLRPSPVEVYDLFLQRLAQEGRTEKLKLRRLRYELLPALKA